MTAPLPGSDSEVDDELESMDKFPNLCVSNQHTVPHILIYIYHIILIPQSHTVTQSHSQPHSHRVNINIFIEITVRLKVYSKFKKLPYILLPSVHQYLTIC